MNISQKSISRKEHITVDFLVKNSKDLFRLKLFSDGSGFERKIVDQNIHRPGLALAGFVDLFSYSRVQIFGNTEIDISNSSAKKKSKTLLSEYLNLTYHVSS